MPELQPGDIIHVETPLNPTGEAINLQYYADKAHKARAFLIVDATFDPPPLQNPFDFGADIVLHSGINTTATALVAWFHSQLHDASTVVHESIQQVHHASLQAEATEQGSWLQKQMPNGYGAVLSITPKDAVLTKRLPSKLGLFQHATSLGGVESLVEWRAMTNTCIDQKLARLGIGVEALEDLASCSRD